MFAAACIVAAGAALVTAIYAIGITDKNATARDYIEYWADGQLLVRGANPYDIPAILRLEQSVGMDGSVPKVSFSPPVALELVLPLGHVGPKAGLIAWLLLELACAGLSAWLLWFLHGKPQSRYHLLIFAFPPTLACLMAGQLGVFFLLGVVLFLCLNQTHPWLAGASLVLYGVKPHLFLPFVPVLFLDLLRRRDLRIPAGLALAIAASCALSVAVDPHAWSQYHQMLHSMRMMDVFFPTVGEALRFLIRPGTHWLGFLPEAAACLWAAWFYWSRRERWNWADHGLPLLLVAVAAAPYSWFTDEAIVFPAILAAIYRSEKSLRAWIFLGAVTAASLVGVFWEIPLPSSFYVWTAPAWLAWYLYAMHSGVDRQPSDAAVTPA